MTPDQQHTPADVWLGALIRAWRDLHVERCARIDAEGDRDAYRELAQLAIHALADLTERHHRQTERYHALLDERRQRAA
jgi:hypothetical protein